MRRWVMSRWAYPGRRAWRLGGAVALAILRAALPTEGVAMPAPFIDPGVIGAPSWPEGEACARAGAVTAQCVHRPEGRGLRCELEAVWEVEGQTRGDDAVGRLWGVAFAVRTVRCEDASGQWSSCLAGPPEDDLPVDEPRSLAGVESRRTVAPVAWISADLPPTRVKVQGTIDLPQNREPFGWLIPAVWTRHLWLSGPSHDYHYHLSLQAPAAAGCPRMSWAARVELPDGLNLLPSVSANWEYEDGAWRGRGEGRLHLAVESPVDLPIHGGPVLAAGARLDSSRRAQLRLAWEIAAPRYGLWSVAVESNLHDDWRAVLAFDVATPFALVLPSLGVGLGLPIRGGPNGTRVGLRGQITVSIPVVSLYVPMDWFPSDPHAPDRFQISAMGAVSF